MRIFVTQGGVDTTEGTIRTYTDKDRPYHILDKRADPKVRTAVLSLYQHAPDVFKEIEKTKSRVVFTTGRINREKSTQGKVDLSFYSPKQGRIIDAESGKEDHSVPYGLGIHMQAIRKTRRIEGRPNIVSHIDIKKKGDKYFREALADEYMTVKHEAEHARQAEEWTHEQKDKYSKGEYENRLEEKMARSKERAAIRNLSKSVDEADEANKSWNKDNKAIVSLEVLK
jgi:hypothetical protein